MNRGSNTVVILSEKERQKRENKRKHTLKTNKEMKDWLIKGLTIAIIPFVIVVIILWVSNNVITLEKIIGNGELLLVEITLLIPWLIEISNIDSKLKGKDSLLIGVIGVLLISAVIYGLAYYNYLSGYPAKDRVVYFSIFDFICCIAFIYRCISLREHQHNIKQREKIYDR